MTHAFRSLRSRPLESLLLVLTIAFGVALCGLVLSAAWSGLGSAGIVSAPGLNNHELTVVSRAEDYSQFYSAPDAPPVARVGRVGDAAVVMEEADLGRLKAAAPAVKAAYLTEYSAMGDLTKGLEVRMASRDYLEALGATLVQGAFPGTAEYRDKTPVVVLTEYGAKFLFSNRAALGQSLEGFRVIGVMKVPDSEKFQFRSVDQNRFGPLGVIPYGADVAQGVSGVSLSHGPLSSLHFLPFPGQDAEATQQLGLAARKTWGDRVHLSSNGQQAAEYSKQARRGAQALALLGLCGLLIASLSVLSLMLARVLSRQRQLGMAAALGASRARLRAQSLVEVTVLGTLGSVLGGLMATGLLWWLNRDVNPSATSTYGSTLAVTPAAILSTVAGGIVLSVVFGLLPAVQASKVRPAEALRA